MELDDIIIKYSVGVGSTLMEAELALNEAKKGNKDDLFNIVCYKGEKLDDKEVINPNINAYKRILEFLEKKGADDKILSDHASLLEDPMTGLLNKLGYEYIMSKNENREGYFLFFDGNCMKQHNDKKGYKNVDKYLEATGKAIQLSTRTKKDKRIKERTGERREANVKDVVAHRVHDSGGDEFLVYLPLNEKVTNLNIIDITKRILNNIYEEERKLAILDYNSK